MPVRACGGLEFGEDVGWGFGLGLGGGLGHGQALIFSFLFLLFAALEFVFGLAAFVLGPLLHEDGIEGGFAGSFGEFGARCEGAEEGVVGDFFDGLAGGRGGLGGGFSVLRG